MIALKWRFAQALLDLSYALENKGQTLFDNLAEEYEQYIRKEKSE